MANNKLHDYHRIVTLYRLMINVCLCMFVHLKSALNSIQMARVLWRRRRRPKARAILYVMWGPSGGEKTVAWLLYQKLQHITVETHYRYTLIGKLNTKSYTFCINARQSSSG